MLALLVRKIFKPILGRRRLQRIFELIHSFSEIGMNIGADASPRDSGEAEALKYIINRFPEPDKLVIFDVGANQGDYSDMVIELAGQRAHIYAFEPARKIFIGLSRRLGEKGIKLFNFGFSDSARTAVLHYHPSESGLSSLYERQLDHYGLDLSNQEEISLQTIDSFCEASGITRIHLLKLDVEGHEINVLAGAAHMLESGRIESIQFEFGGADIDSRTFFRDFYNLLHNQYDIYRIVRDGLYRIEKYKEGYELFYMANYLAVKKR